MNQAVRFPATLMPDQDWWQALWPDPAGVLRSVGIEPGMAVVDLCCGNGHFTRPMCEQVHPGMTWALDLDTEQLAHAQQFCQGYGNFHAILGDARELPKLLDEPVDFVFIANTFHGVPDKTGLAHAVHETLKSGGRFAIVNWYPQPREETMVLDLPRGPATELRMAPENVRQVVEPAGFKLENNVAVGPYHYAAVFYSI